MTSTRSPSIYRHRQRGAALVIGLLLLVIITLLAVTGMTTANTELIMAGNEQQRINGFRAAETGVDDAVADVGNVGTILNACRKVGPRDVFASASDKYTTGTLYLGSGGIVPGWGVYSGEGHFFAIRSTGIGARGARTNLAQGVVQLTNTSGEPASTFTALIDPVTNPVGACEPDDPAE